MTKSQLSLRLYKNTHTWVANRHLLIISAHMQLCSFISNLMSNLSWDIQLQNNIHHYIYRSFKHERLLPLTSNYNKNKDLYTYTDIWHYHLKMYTGMEYENDKKLNETKFKTCKSRYIGIFRLRSQIISEMAFSWLRVSEYGRALKKCLVRLHQSSAKTTFDSGFLYFSSNLSFSIFVPSPSSIWNNRPNC